MPASLLQNDATLRTAWDGLNDGHLALPFMASDVIAAALTCFGSGREQLLSGFADGALHAMIVVTPQGRLRWATFQPSQLPLGAWVANADLSPDAVSQQLLRSGALGQPLVVSVTQVDTRQAARQEDTPSTRHDDYIQTSWIDVEGSFDDYWAARGKNLRQNLRKQRNKLATDGVQTTLEFAATAADIAPALVRYGRLESTGWKAGGGTAIDVDNVQGRFYQQVLQEAAERGEAWVATYRFNDQTVAMNLGLVRRGVLVVLKTAYDESMPKTQSPASLLREDELRQIFARGDIKRVEFYGRTMEWHTKLTEQQRTLYHLTTYRWPWVKRFAERRQAATRQSQAQPVGTTVSPADPA